MRIAIVWDNLSPHLSTKKDRRLGEWARRTNVALAYVLFYASWLNRIEAQFTALLLPPWRHRPRDPPGPRRASPIEARQEVGH